jgi:lantibiotic modifying enzyme
MNAVEAALARAGALAQEVAAAAIIADGMAGFHGAFALPGEAPTYRLFGGDFYEGSAGIARMLLWAGQMTDRPKLVRLAQQALRHALEHTPGWSLHSGLLGSGLVAFEAGNRLGNRALARAGTAASLRALDAALAEAQTGTAALDHIAGLAGAVFAAAKLATTEVSDHRQFGALARQLAEHLAAVGEPAAVGRAWRMSPHDPGPPLAGLAHGAAGVALAFTALAAIDARGAERWLALAAEARAFERLHVDSERGSWADLRVASDPGSPTAPPCPHFWCHGSVGIAQERLLAWQAVPGDPLIATDLAIALAGARAAATALLAGPVGPGAGDAANGSLCHGAAGFIDVLVATGEESDRAMALRLSAFLDADRQARHHPRSGMPGGWGTPGLMLGTAGIVWGHLRAARPDVVPAGWNPASGLLVPV